MVQVLTFNGDSGAPSWQPTDARVLWLVRHAKSSWSSGVDRDHERPLAPRGERDSARLGAWLEQHGVHPSLIWCSTAVRTRQTLALARRGWHVPELRIAYRPSLYHASLEAMLALLAQVPERASSIMLLGHNPGLDDLLEALCGPELPRTAKGKLLTTANAAGVIIEAERWGSVKAGDGRLEVLVRPR